MMSEYKSLDIIDDDSVRERVKDIRSQIKGKSQTDEQWKVLDARRDACERAKEPLNEHPVATPVLCPLLVTVLETELTRTATSSVDAMLLGDLSVEIQRFAAQALGTPSESALLDAYEQTANPFERLITTLGTTIVHSQSYQVRIASAEVLATFCWGCPDDLVEILETEFSVQGLLGDICMLLVDTQSEETILAGIRLILLLSSRATATLQLTLAMQEGLNAASRRGSPRCRLLGTHITDHFECPGSQVPTINPQTPDDGIDKLITDVHDEMDGSWSVDIDRQVQALGEVVALTSNSDSRTLPDALIDEMKTEEVLHRSRAARALGIVLIATQLSQTERFIQTLADRAAKSTNKFRWAVVRALGETTVATNTGNDDLPASLTKFVRKSTGTDRRLAAMALGEIVLQTPDDGSYIPERLVKDINDGFLNDQRPAARTLGMLVFATDEVSVPVPQSVIDKLHDESGTDLLELIGEVAAAVHNSPSKPVVELLLDRLRDPDYGYRRTARALGELAVLTTQVDSVTIPPAVIDAIRERTDPTSKSIVIALGTGIAVAYRTGRTNLIRALAHQVKSAIGLKRQRLAQALGELVSVLESTRFDHIPQPLMNRTEVQLDREQEARVLGEVVSATEVGQLEDSIDSLCAEIRDSTGSENRRQAAQALGEILATSEYDEEFAAACADSDQVLNSTGDRREWAARAVGEFAAAARRGEDETVHQILLTKVSGRSGVDQSETLKTLGTVVPLIEDKIEHNAPADLLAQARSSRTGAMVLGRWVQQGPRNAVTYLATEIQESVLHKTELGELLQTLATAETLSATEFVQAVTPAEEASTGEITLESYLDEDNLIREQVLMAIATAIAPDTNPQFPALRERLQTFLIQPHTVPTATRLAVADLLVNLGGQSTQPLS